MNETIHSNVCTSCNGKGFNWKKGHILNKRTGSEIATIYSHGDTCEDCGGSGECGLDAWGKFVVALVALILSAFVIMPLIKAWLD